MMPELPAAATELVESITQPGYLADLIAANVDVPIEEKQQVLETVDLKERMKLVLELLNRKREILKLSSKIDSQVKGEMSKTQREYYLRQQDRKSTRLNSSHLGISYAVFCLKKKRER